LTIIENIISLVANAIFWLQSATLVYFYRISLRLLPAIKEEVRNISRIPVKRPGIWMKKHYIEMRSLMVTMVSRPVRKI